MPVNWLPAIWTLFLIGVPVLALLLKRKATSIVTGILSLLIIGVLLLRIYIPGWVLMVSAWSGDPKAEYDYARWNENHCEAIQETLLWPCSPDVLTGYAWLEKAAKQDYPPALYVVGVRLKYGQCVPRPMNWTGPEGNYFPQPQRGQKLIDRAVQLGYAPADDEDDEVTYYTTVYRKWRNW